MKEEHRNYRLGGEWQIARCAMKFFFATEGAEVTEEVEYGGTHPRSLLHFLCELCVLGGQ